MDVADNSKWNNVSRFMTMIYGVAFSIQGLLTYIANGNSNYFFTGITITAIFLLTLIIFKEKPSQGYIYICSLTLGLSIMFWNLYALTTFTLFNPMGVMFVFSITTFTVCALSWLKEYRAQS